MLDVKPSTPLRRRAGVARRLLQAEPGKVTCVLGRNGVGKTSLLDALMGQHPVSRGSIMWEGARHHRAHALRARPPRHRLCAAGPRDLSAADRAGKSGDRLCAAEARRPADPGRRVLAVPGAEQTCCAGAAATSPAASSSSSRSAARWSCGPRLLLLDEPTEGIQPSIIKDIGRAITLLRELGQMAIVLVEQYLDFARELGDRFAVMDRGAVVHACERQDMDEGALRRAMALEGSECEEAAVQHCARELFDAQSRRRTDRARGRRRAQARAGAARSTSRARCACAFRTRMRPSCEAVIVNTAGGIAGGDRLRYRNRGCQ